jgi:hypothetical protein
MTRVPMDPKDFRPSPLNPDWQHGEGWGLSLDNVTVPLANAL